MTMSTKSSDKRKVVQSSQNASNPHRIKVPTRNPHKRIARGNVERSLARMKARELEALGKRY
ncbi:hypothetical protein [Exiguobacterium sp. s26]|uniref:hypothetical protein n=1 Tax=Exiguobacterium sp. s26 TaxID=2751231 RepID=UPI001BED26CE|nr:hypothetical protein [Exiguobacterium sp. s26]